MRRTFLIILSAAGIVINFASCKTNTNDLPQTTTQTSALRMPTNGEVTDSNGIIGDSDDFVVDSQASKNNIVQNAGEVVNNVSDRFGDTIQNIADDVGNAVKQTEK